MQKALLADIQRQLETEIERLRRALEQLDQSETPPPSDERNSEDENAAGSAELADGLSVADDIEKALRDTEIALDRLKKGSYGICKYCQKPIDERRLLARPTSSSCVECKKTFTQEM